MPKVAVLLGGLVVAGPASAFQTTYNAPLINGVQAPITTAAVRAQENPGSEVRRILLAIFSGLTSDTSAAQAIQSINGAAGIASRCLLQPNRVSLMNPVVRPSSSTADTAAPTIDSRLIAGSGNRLFRLTPDLNCEGLTGIQSFNPDLATDSPTSFTSSILNAAYSAIRVGTACSGNCPNLVLVSSLRQLKPLGIPLVFTR